MLDPFECGNANITFVIEKEVCYLRCRGGYELLVKDMIGSEHPEDSFMRCVAVLCRGDGWATAVYWVKLDRLEAQLRAGDAGEGRQPT